MSRIEDLLMDLSSDLLRGVPMHVLLRRFGVEWKQVTGPDALKWRPRLSRETRKYSHLVGIGRF